MDRSTLAKLKVDVHNAEEREKAINLHLGYKEDYQRGSLAILIRWDHLADLIAIVEGERTLG